MGLTGSHVNDLISLVDEIGMQQNLETMPLGVRFATVKTKQNRPKIWKGD